MTKRETGLDFLRCLALLMVVIFHSFLHNGYYYEPQTGAAMLLAGSVRWLSVSCNGLFLMLSGYLLSRKMGLISCWKRLLQVLAVYLLASALCIPIRHFFLGEPQPLSVWLGKLAGFGAVQYGWYVEMYLGLVLLAPFVNRMMAQQSDRGLLGFCAVLLGLTALPGATPLNLAPDWWRSLYPLTYYVLGAAVRRLQPKVSPWLALFGALTVSLGMGAVTLLSTDGRLDEALTWEFADLWVVIITVCLFVALYRVSMTGLPARILAFAAEGCYGGYLLSSLLDACCYDRVGGWKSPESYILIFLCITVPLYITAILGGRLLQRIADRLFFRERKVAK